MLFESTDQYWIMKTPFGYGGEGLKIYRYLDQVYEVINEVRERNYDE